MNRDQDVLIDEILKRVKKKLAECEPAAAAGAPACCAAPAAEDARPRVLILAREHGEVCHQLLESAELNRYFSVACASQTADCCVKNYEAVIAFGLSLEDLGKIANGIFDDDYRKTVGMALLFGKKVFMPEEKVSLLNLGNTAPTAFYRSLEEMLRVLRNSGLTLVPGEKLAAAVIAGIPHNAKFSPAVFSGGYEPLVKPAAKAALIAPAVGETTVYTKRVLTERSVKAAAQDGVAEIRLPENAIVTDLARDSAAKFNIRLVKEEA